MLLPACDHDHVAWAWFELPPGERSYASRLEMAVLLTRFSTVVLNMSCHSTTDRNSHAIAVVHYQYEYEHVMSMVHDWHAGKDPLPQFGNRGKGTP